MTEYEKRLLEALEKLPEDQQQQLVDYAEFLVARAGAGFASDLTPIPYPLTPCQTPGGSSARLSSSSRSVAASS